jgi:hypothetical protein
MGFEKGEVLKWHINFIKRSVIIFPGIFLHNESSALPPKEGKKITDDSFGTSGAIIF